MFWIIKKMVGAPLARKSRRLARTFIAGCESARTTQ